MEVVQNPAGEVSRLRQALGRFATGVTVITTQTADGKKEGVTVNSFASVSLQPPLVLWSLRKDAGSAANFIAAGRFAINILTAEQRHISDHFARPKLDKFSDIPHAAGLLNCPVLSDVLAIFECRTEATLEGGDHLVFVGRVERVEYREGNPLIFSSGTYGTHAPLESLRPKG